MILGAGRSSPYFGIVEVARRKGSWLVYYTIAFDESGKHEDQFLRVAACAAPELRWQAISEDWVRILAKNRLGYLHMKEAMHFKGQFKGWNDRAPERDRVLKELADLVIPHVTLSIAAIKTSDFKSLPERQRERHLNESHYGAFETCVKATMSALAKESKEYRIHLCCDSSEQYAPTLLKLYRKLRAQSQEFKLRAVGISFFEDEHYPPIQFADLVAYSLLQRDRHGVDGPAPVIQSICVSLAQHGLQPGGECVFPGDGVSGLGDGILQVNEDPPAP